MTLTNMMVSAVAGLAFLWPGAANAQIWEDPPFEGELPTAFSSFYDPFTVYARDDQGILDVTAIEESSGEFEGTIFGDEATGYLRGTTVIIIRWRDGKPYEVYVGQQQRGVGGPERSTMSGVTYALSSDAGAQPEQNRWRFTAGQFNAPIRPDLADSLTPASEPVVNGNGVWRARANSTIQRPMVLNVDGDGNVSGWLLGDEILGHYASDTGSLAFLRFDNGAPIQFYHTQLSNGRSVDGQFYALTDGAGGVFNANNTFDFDLQDQALFYHVRHEWELFNPNRIKQSCLGILSNAQGNGALLRQLLCDDRMDVHIGRSPLSTPDEYELVMRHSGKCLTAPTGSAGGLIEQQDCAGTRSQAFRLTPYVSNGFFRISPAINLNACVVTASENDVIAAELAVNNECIPDNFPSQFTKGKTWFFRPRSDFYW